MLRRPPRSTLFPTRRSSDLHGVDVQVERQLGQRFRGERQEIARLLDAGPDSDHPDRKSTRLNSSHPSISYAVFCLKKKKNNINEPAQQRPPTTPAGTATHPT